MPDGSLDHEQQPASSAVRLAFSAEGARLLELARSSSNGRAAATLAKNGPLHLTLLALRQDAVVNDHRAPDSVSIHLLSGLAEISVAGEAYMLSPGEALMLEASVTHGVRAAADSVILLTLAVPQ